MVASGSVTTALERPVPRRRWVIEARSHAACSSFLEQSGLVGLRDVGGKDLEDASTQNPQVAGAEVGGLRDEMLLGPGP
jgi:hypothetical protein